MKSTNGMVACRPFGKRTAETKQKGTLAEVTTKASLVATDVVYPSDDGKFNAGDKVYFDGDTVVKTESGKVFSVEPEVEFILLEARFVRLRS